MARVVETRFPQGRGLPRLPRLGERLHAHRTGGGRGRAPGHEHPRPRQDHRRGSGSGAIALGGRARDGKRSYVQYEIFAGGVGGRNGKDGASATSFHLSNGKIAPVEIIESEFPTQVERFEFPRDSGGPGRHRGGLGFVGEYRIPQDEVRFSMPKPTVFRRQLPRPLPHRPVIGPRRPIPVDRRIHPYQTATPPLRVPPFFHRPVHRPSRGAGRQKFFPSITLSVDTSSTASANRRFSFAFSNSGLRSRFASDTSSPPYFAATCRTSLR